MFARISACVALLVACEPGKPTHEVDKAEVPKAVEHKKVDALKMVVPDGWTATYDATSDKWRFGSPVLADGRTSSVIVERAPEPMTVGPEALRHYLQMKVWDKGSTADIESRTSLSDGFATTLVVHGAADPAHPTRETYVIRQLGNEWFRCACNWVVDDAMRDQVVALCRSLKR